MSFGKMASGGSHSGSSLASDCPKYSKISLELRIL